MECCGKINNRIVRRGYLADYLVKRKRRMFKDIKWLFFDVGCTLVDESKASKRRFREIAKNAGLDACEVEGRAIELYKQNIKGDTAIAKSLGVECPLWYTEEELLYDYSKRCLEKLRPYYKIGVIANQVLGTSERLQKFGILKYIDLVVSSAEEGVSKPDPQIYLLALKKANCAPEQALMIGDRIDNDIIPAASVGMRTVWVKQGYFGKYWSAEKANCNPDLIVDKLIDICPYLI